MNGRDAINQMDAPIREFFDEWEQERERIGALQHRLTAGGFLTGSFKFGFFTEETAKAVKALHAAYLDARGLL